MFERIQQAVDQQSRGQRGLVMSAQALSAGLTERQVREHVDAGRWERLHRGVLLSAAAPRDWRQELLAACMATEVGVVSHRSAAALFGYWQEGVVEVTVPRRHQPRSRAGMIVHRSRDLFESMVTTRDGLWVTTPGRAIVDLGAVASEAAVDQAMDACVGRKLASFGELAGLLDELGRKGRRGVGVVRRCLDRRHWFDADSELELRMERLLREHDLPAATPQYVVWSDGRLIGKVDFAYGDRKIAIEVDGFGPHSSPGAFQYDRARQNDLVAAGWTVLRFTWDDVVRRPRHVASVIRRVLGAETDA